MLKAALQYVGNRLARPIYAGVGSIIALHRVIPDEQRSRLPANRALEIRPEDLEAIICLLRDLDYEFMPLAAVPKRLRAPTSARFAAFTLDDGYCDNLEHALPIFNKHQVPFTVFATQAFSEHRDSVWWYALEAALFSAPRLQFRHAARNEALDLPDQAARMTAFGQLAERLRACSLIERDELIGAICKAADLDPLQTTRQLILTEDELVALSREPLVTLGAHSRHHLTSNRLSDSDLHNEFGGSKAWLEELTGQQTHFLAYPFGGRNAVGAREFEIAAKSGFHAGMTTRFGNLFPQHAKTLMSLPRLEISGNYRAKPFTERSVSGLLPAVRNRGRRLAK